MSERIDDGGVAFPVSLPGMGDNGAHGMTLRQWYAGLAMAAYLSNVAFMQDLLLQINAKLSPDNQKIQRDVMEQIVATRAFRTADAMITASKPPRS